MMIIGISGKKQSGKDEVCKRIQHHFPKAVRIAFADALKEEVAKACGVTVPYIEEHKDNFRLILQGWGTDFRRKLKGERYWIDEWCKRMLKSDAPIVVVPDVRFENEFKAVRELRGHLFRVNRPQCDMADGHPSETQLDFHTFDRVIANDRTLEALKNEVDITLEMHGLI